MTVRSSAFLTTRGASAQHREVRRWLPWIALGLFGCATAAPGLKTEAPKLASPAAQAARHDEEPPLPQVRDGRERLLTAARNLLGAKHVRPSKFGDDCTGYVRAVYSHIGFTLMSEGHDGDNGVTAIWRFARMHGRVFYGGHPMPGDLVFFRNTYDRNRDGAHDDGRTHIAIVEGEEPDGTLRILHHTSHGIVREHMNLTRPHEHLDPRTGNVINDYLRSQRSGEPALSAELFAGFAALFTEPLRVVRAERGVEHSGRSARQLRPKKLASSR
jgi:hypothetical protein